MSKRGVIERGIILAILFLIAVGIAHSFGVSTPYLENNTLTVTSGERYEYKINIQNSDDEDYYTELRYKSTNDVASLNQTGYYVPAKTYNTTVYFYIDIPKEDKAGTRYLLDYSVKPQTSGNETISVGVEINRDLSILVTKNAAEAQVVEVEEVLARDTYKEKLTRLKDSRLIGQSKKYLIIGIAIAMLIFVVILVWKLSRKIASRLREGKVTDYTLSEALNVKEVKAVLKKMSDEEFEVSDIKDIFRNKVSEFTTKDVASNISYMPRKEAISALDKIMR